MLMTIIAEHGTSTNVPSNRPPTLQTTEIITDSNIMTRKRLENTSAVIIGIDSIDISSMTPTSRIVSTMHTAIITVIV